MSQIIDNFGKGSVMKLGQRRAMDVESVSTGSLSLDVALGIGGLPKGRVVEVYGPESSGKTTLALQVLAEAQKAGGICAFIDAEHALDPIYAKKLGVDTEELLISVTAQVKAAEIANEGITVEYEAGLGRSTLDVIQSNSILLSSKISLADSERNYLLSQFKLLQAIGLLNSNYLKIQ